jgi:PAS domain-containing protein
VDTNIVIDALYQRIQEKLNRSNHFEDSTNQRSHFAGYLLHLAENDRVDLWVPDVVRGEIRNIARSMGDVRKRFDNSFIESKTLDSTLTSEIIETMVEDLIGKFSTWNGSNDEFETDSSDEELIKAMVDFFIEHEEIYDEITKMKEFYGDAAHRTTLDGRKIYPEQPDRMIMQYAAVLSSRPIDNVGAIIVATHDGDFTVVARAFEERFGFGIAKNSRTLSPWLRS